MVKLFSLFCPTWHAVLKMFARLFRIEQVKALRKVYSRSCLQTRKRRNQDEKCSCQFENAFMAFFFFGHHNTYSNLSVIVLCGRKNISDSRAKLRTIFFKTRCQNTGIMRDASDFSSSRLNRNFVLMARFACYGVLALFITIVRFAIQKDSVIIFYHCITRNKMPTY